MLFRSAVGKDGGALATRLQFAEHCAGIREGIELEIAVEQVGTQEYEISREAFLARCAATYGDVFTLRIGPGARPRAARSIAACGAGRRRRGRTPRDGEPGRPGRRR